MSASLYQDYGMATNIDSTHWLLHTPEQLLSEYNESNISIRQGTRRHIPLTPERFESLLDRHTTFDLSSSAISNERLCMVLELTFPSSSIPCYDQSASYSTSDVQTDIGYRLDLPFATKRQGSNGTADVRGWSVFCRGPIQVTKGVGSGYTLL